MQTIDRYRQLITNISILLTIADICNCVADICKRVTDICKRISLDSNVRFLRKRKGKEEYLYSANLVKEVHSKRSGAQAWITQFYLQITPYLPFLRERSPDGTTTATEASRHSIAAYYSFIDPERMKG